MPRLKGTAWGEEVASEVTVDVRRLGDVDGNGFVNLHDKVLLEKRVRGMATAYPDRAYDLDGDGAAAQPADRSIMDALQNGFDVP